MKLLIRYGLVMLVLAVCNDPAPLFAQQCSMSEEARNIWLQKNPDFKGDKDFQFDRITGQGELVVFERFNPASFIILMKADEVPLLVGYSFRNLFFGNPSGQAKQAELLDALSTAGQMDWGRLKGTRSLTSSVGPLIRSQWGQGKFFNYYCPRDVC